MKKVFFIMSTDAASGAEAVNATIIEKLSHKYDFYWVSKRGEINAFLSERGIKWIEISELSVSEIKRVVRDGRPDILHATDYRASAVAASAKGDAKLICHVHANPLWLGKLCPNSVAFAYACKRSSAVLGVSASIEDEYIFRGTLKGKFVNMSNPVYREKIASLAGGAVEKVYDICCVGRLTDAKDPMRFLEIIAKIRKKIPDLRALWIGGGELEGEFLQKIMALGLDECVEYAGFLKNPYEHLKKAKIFILASKWEGYGLVAYEALSLGLPCVVANVGGLPEIADESCGMLCDTDGEYVEAAEKLLSSSEMLKAYSDAALERAEKLENIDSYMEKLCEIYEKN